MDLSAGFDIPNPFGLRSQDFEYEMDSYSVALRFLSDLASGTEEVRALQGNGGSEAMLREWERSPKFRRVLHKCRAAGADNRRYLERQERDQGHALTGPGQRFVPLDRMPVRRRSLFTHNPNAESWGGVAPNLPA